MSDEYLSLAIQQAIQDDAKAQQQAQAQKAIQAKQAAQAQQVQQAQQVASAPVAPPQDVGQRASQIANSMGNNPIGMMGDLGSTVVNNAPYIAIPAALYALHKMVAGGSQGGYGQAGQSNVPQSMPLYPEQAAQQSALQQSAPQPVQQVPVVDNQGLVGGLFPPPPAADAPVQGQPAIPLTEKQLQPNPYLGGTDFSKVDLATRITQLEQQGLPFDKALEQGRTELQNWFDYQNSNKQQVRQTQGMQTAAPVQGQPDIPLTKEQLIAKSLGEIQQETGKKNIPAGNPKVTAGEVGSLVESEKNAAANQQAAYSKANPKPPGEERWLAGQWQSKKNPERAKTLIEGLKSSLPEGEKLQFPVNSETGKPMGGMPSREHVINFTNDLLGTKMSSEEFKDFKITPEHLDKMHEELTKRLESAKTPEAIAKAQKGFATLGMLAGMAGVGLAGIGAYSAYQHGKKTGDWSDLGQMAMDTGAGLIKGLRGAAAVPYAFATHTGSLNSNESEELAKRTKMPPTISRK